MKLVSIIVPAYNEEKQIKKCIDSLLKQTYKNIEIIVVDDGSADDTLKILNEYNDKRLIIVSKENGGQGSARNVGIKKASGQYLMFVDSDDYVCENIVELLMNDLKQNDSDISICDLYKVYDDKMVYFNNLEKFTENNVINFMLSHPGPVCRLYKKSLFINNNIFFKENAINEDLGTIPLLGLYAKKISYIHRALYYYVIHENSSTMQMKYSKKLEDIFIIMDHLQNEFKKRSNSQYQDVLEYLYIEHLLYSSSLKLINFKEGKKQILKAVNIIKVNFPNWRKNKYYKKKSLKFKAVCNLVYLKQFKIVKLLKKIRK